MIRKLVLALSATAMVWGASAALAEEATATGATAAADLAAQYHLGVSDKIRILTFGEGSLTGEFVVGASGNVALPLIGEIRAQGLTTIEFAHAMEEKLKDGYLTDPKVSVEVANFRPFYILGEVTKPGEYPYANGLTVQNAVATANGFTYRADTKHVVIRHANDTKEATVDLTSSTLVQPGDTIKIRERFF